MYQMEAELVVKELVVWLVQLSVVLVPRKLISHIEIILKGFNWLRQNLLFWLLNSLADWCFEKGRPLYCWLANPTSCTNFYCLFIQLYWYFISLAQAVLFLYWIQFRLIGTIRPSLKVEPWKVSEVKIRVSTTALFCHFFVGLVIFQL